MYDRIAKLSQSPCNKCGVKKKCKKKRSSNSSFREIMDVIFRLKNYDYHSCPLYISLTGPKELIEEGDEVSERI